MKDKNEKLNFENFDKLAFELLKQENRNSTTIKLNWNGYSLEKDEIKKIYKDKEEQGISLDTAFINYVEENNESISLELDDALHDLAYEVTSKYTDFEEGSDLFFEMKDKLYQYVTEQFTKDYDLDQVLKNTKVEEIVIFLKSENTNYPSDERDDTFCFNNLVNEDTLQEFFSQTKFNSVAFLIQSQGYEVEDIFDIDKINSSKFLSSLRNELDCSTFSNTLREGNIVFAKLGNNDFKDVIELTDSKKILIPKEIANVGLYDLETRTGSELTIKIEKDIVLDEKNFVVMNEYNNGRNEELLKYYVHDNDEKNKFIFNPLPDKEAFEMKKINVEKVIEKYKEYFSEELENKKDKEKEKEF